MARVSIAIQAHPSRAAWVEQLVAELGADADAEVFWAEPPFATANDWRPIWRTKREALLAGLVHGAPFHCVIQDDALLAPDFRRRLERLVEHGPHLYMLFFRRKRAYPLINEQASAVGPDESGFLTRRGPILGPGLVFPQETIAELVAYGDRDPGRDGDDDRIRRFIRSGRGPEVFVAIPSLVDHRDGPSLIGHPGAGRNAWRFAA